MNSQKPFGPFSFLTRGFSFVLLVLFVSNASAQFTTILNIPPDPNIGSFQSIGSDTQLNLFDTGFVGFNFDANSGSTVNISGGSVGSSFDAHNGSTVNISGGSVGVGFDAFSGSVVTISGGSVGDNFVAFGGSTVNISGGEFRLDGVLVGGLESEGSTVSLEVPLDALFTGTLADGTPFAFTSADRFSFSSTGADGFSIFSDGDDFASGVLTLEASDLPPVGPALITASTDAVPLGIRQGQLLRVDDGGVVPGNFNAGPGSTVNVEAGGRVGGNLEADGAQVNISGGSVGSGFDAFSGSTVNISGGSVSDRFDANSGSEMNISGGSFGDDFNARSGSVVNLSGGEFRMDGLLVGGLESEGNMVPLEVPLGAVFSGTLADGTPFAFTSADSDSFASGVLTLKAATLPPVGPALITASTDAVPLGIRQGQLLLVDDGGVVPDNFNAGLGSNVIVEAGGSVGENLEAVGAQVNISGGSVGDNFDVFNSTVNISGGSVGGFTGSFQAFSGSVVNISGGSVGSSFDAFSGSTVNISGGSVGNGFGAGSGSVVNISGGSVGNSFRADSGSVVNISGGSVGILFRAFSGSTVNISGGLVGDGFRAFSGSTVNLFGTQFVLDQLDITDSLTLNEPFTINDRNVTLEGLLADGSAFAFDLNSANVFFSGSFDLGATLTVTLVETAVPEPASAVLALLGASIIVFHRRRHGTGVGKRRI